MSEQLPQNLSTEQRPNKYGYWISIFLIALSLFFFVGPFSLRVGFVNRSTSFSNGWIPFIFLAVMMFSFALYYYRDPSGSKGSKKLLKVWVLLGLAPLPIILIMSGGDPSFGGIVAIGLSVVIIGSAIIFSKLLSKLLANVHTNKFGDVNALLSLSVLVLAISLFQNYNSFTCGDTKTECKNKFAEADIIKFCETEQHISANSAFNDEYFASFFNDCIAKEAVRLHRLDYCDKLSGGERSTSKNREALVGLCKKVVSDSTLSNKVKRGWNWKEVLN